MCSYLTEGRAAKHKLTKTPDNVGGYFLHLEQLILHGSLYFLHRYSAKYLSYVLLAQFFLIADAEMSEQRPCILVIYPAV